MIERQTLDGRSATIAYMTDAFEPADKDTASYAKVLFDDGEMLLLAAPKRGVVLGYSMAEWAAYFVKTDLARIDTAIKTGLIAGLDNTEIARRVIGSVGLRGVDGVTEITRQQIAHLGRIALKGRS